MNAQTRRSSSGKLNQRRRSKFRRQPVPARQSPEPAWVLGAEDDPLAVYKEVFKAVSKGILPAGVPWLPSGAASRTWLTLVLSAGVSAAVVSWLGDLGRPSLPVPVKPHIRPLHRLPPLQMPAVQPRAITYVEAVPSRPQSVMQPSVDKPPAKKPENDKRSANKPLSDEPPIDASSLGQPRTQPPRSFLAATAAGGARLGESRRGEQTRRPVDQQGHTLIAGAAASPAPRIVAPGGATDRGAMSQRDQDGRRSELAATAGRSPARGPGAFGAAPAGFALLDARDWPALEVLLSSVRRWAGRASDTQLRGDPAIYIDFVGDQPIIYVSRQLTSQGDRTVRRALERLMEGR